MQVNTLTFEELDRLSIRTGCETETNRAADLELRRRGYVFDAWQARWIKLAPDPSVGTPQLKNDDELNALIERAINAPKLDTNDPVAVRAWAEKLAADGVAAGECEFGTPPSADDQTGRPLERYRMMHVNDMGEDYMSRCWIEAELAHDSGFKQPLQAGKFLWVRADEVDALEAELTRLRAELAERQQEMQAWLDNDQTELVKLDARYTALLIDLRALVEQWKFFSESDELWIKNLETLEQAEPDEDLPDIVRERMIVRNQCIEALAARLSREPHQD